MIKAVKNEDEDDSPNPQHRTSEDGISSCSSKSPKNNYQTHCQTAMNIAGIGGRSPTASSQLNNQQHRSATRTTPKAKIGQNHIGVLAHDDDDANYPKNPCSEEKE